MWFAAVSRDAGPRVVGPLAAVSLATVTFDAVPFAVMWFAAVSRDAGPRVVGPLATMSLATMPFATPFATVPGDAVWFIAAL